MKAIAIAIVLIVVGLGWPGFSAAAETENGKENPLGMLHDVVERLDKVEEEINRLGALFLDETTRDMLALLKRMGRDLLAEFGGMHRRGFTEADKETLQFLQAVLEDLEKNLAVYRAKSAPDT